MMLNTFSYVFLICGPCFVVARPSFSSTKDQIKHIDSATGFPLHSNVFQETIDTHGGDIHRSRSLSENSHRIKVKSTAKLHRTACIVLDVILALESIQCRFNVSQPQLELSFNTSSNAASIYKKWSVSAATFVSGGKEWECLNETTQQPILIIQRLQSFQLKNKQIIIKLRKNTHLSPLVCFANITISLAIEQTTTKATPSSRKKRTTVEEVEPKLYTNSWYFTPLEPSGNEIFYPGQTIDVRWSYSNIDRTNDLKVVLNRIQLGWDAQLAKVNTYINVKNITFTIPVSLETSSHDQYYFEFSFRRKLGFYQRTSAIFYISTKPSIIPRFLPALNDIYYPGDIVPIAWTSANFDATSRVTVRFRRARLSIITDITLDTFTVMASANAYNYIISSSLDRTDNDKYYYFEFDYCTSWLAFNCKPLTNHFLVLTRPYVHPTFPTLGDWFSPSQSLTLTWTSVHFTNANDSLTIKLRRYNYLLPDSDIYLFKCPVSSSGFCTCTLPAVSVSLSDYYFEYNWCKHWYSMQCTTKSHRFSIPTQATGSWNYDANRGQAIRPQNLYSTTCDSLCLTRESELSYVCQICADGRPMGIQLSCTNCWATYDYSLIQMDLVRKDNSLTLDYLSVRVQSTISVNLDLSISANYPYVSNGNLPLPSIPIIKPVPFIIGNIQFDLSMSFAPSIPWHVELNTIGNLTGGVDYKLQTNLTLTTSGGNTTKKFDQKLIRNNHPLRGDLQANTKVDLAFRPALQIDIGIFVLEIATEGYMIFEDIWQYPPFDGLPTSNFDWNKQKTAEFHLSVPANACTLSHFIRYHVMFGIRNTTIKFFVTITNSRIEFLNDYILTYSSPSVLDLGPYELTSGCMYVAQQETDTATTLHFVFNRQFNPKIDNNNEYLSRSVIFDLAYALNISQTRLYYNSTYGTQQDLMTGLIITLMPSVFEYTDDTSVFELIEKLQTEEMNSSSLLYSGLITRLLNSEQTCKANALHLSSTNNCTNFSKRRQLREHVNTLFVNTA